MPQSESTRVEENSDTEMMYLCKSLFDEWLFDLSFEEKQIWLWNALVGMCRIKKRRQ